MLDTQHPLNVCSASAGTGKTFTLAAYYVGLLFSDVSYRNILAVTFTNKATDEMKERILSYLYAIAQGDASQQSFFDKAKSFMLPGKIYSDDQLRQRAGQCFSQMLSDYDNVSVSTIDSFLQVLYSGMAQLLGKGAGYSVELDTNSVITQAVDEILSTEMTDTVRPIFVEYMQEQLNDEAGWDIRHSLIGMAKRLYDEHVQMLNAQGKIVFAPAKIKAYKDALAQWQKDIAFQTLKNLLQAIETSVVASDRTVAALIKNIRTSLENNRQQKKSEAFQGINPKTWDKISETETEKYKKKWGENYAAICALQNRCIVCRRIYIDAMLTQACLNDMRLMDSLQGHINAKLMESNRTFLSTTAATLQLALQGGDADFVLEKSGIRYKHIMIDEFQDTSCLQWQVFLPLLTEVMAAEGNTILIVGDIKQSIYRWRNGDWHIMESLGKKTFQEQVNKTFPVLSKNFRSRRNVVQFNLQTMKRIMENPEEEKHIALYNEKYTEDNLNDYYNPKNDGGFVRVRAYPKKKNSDFSPKQIEEEILTDMFQTIESLLEAGERPSDIMILVRKGAEATKVVNFFTNLQHPKATIATSCLQDVRLVSADSFCLNRSTSVLLVISALRYINSEDPVAAKYIELQKNDTSVLEQLRAINPQLPLYEMVQEVIRCIDCDADGNFLYDDLAYINCFLDKVRKYVSSFGSNCRAFLQYWDDVLSEKSISAPETNAIRIMTIHSSKGLESKTLFIPFCSWPMDAKSQKRNTIWCESIPPKEAGVEPLQYVPIQYGNDMATSSYKEQYLEEQENQRVDNLNLLYVALTRAADNLYVYVDQALLGAKNTCPTLEDNLVSTLLVRACGLEEEVLDVFNNGTTSRFAEYTLGEQPYIRKAEVRSTDEIFGFDNATDLSATFCSNSEGVRFRQSQESALYTALSSNAEEVLDHINLGNICHDILAQVEVRNDLPRVIDQFCRRGVIESDQQKEKITSLIDRAWRKSELCDWFSGGWQLLREQAILVNGEECRPDRVMIKGNRAIVLDYKFGAPQDKYAKQVREYMRVMRQLGYADVQGYLWYAQTEELKTIK